MANLPEDLERWFTSLTATNEIVTNFGSTFTSNSNVFLLVEPASPTNSLTIIPYPGVAPDTRHLNAQYPSVQIRVKASTVVKAYKTTKSVINAWHNNDRVGSNIRMKIFAVNSEPLFLKYDVEEYPVFVANFDLMIIKHTIS